MLSTSQEGRGCTAGTMGARFRVRGAPTGDDGAPIGIPEAVGVCALGVVLGVVAHGVKVARIVGDGVAVVVRPVCRSWCGCSWRKAAQIMARVWRSVWRVCS